MCWGQSRHHRFGVDNVKDLYQRGIVGMQRVYPIGVRESRCYRSGHDRPSVNKSEVKVIDSLRKDERSQSRYDRFVTDRIKGSSP